METIYFYKMHGLGNDFVIFDQREGALASHGKKKHTFSKKDILNICDRNKGVGCDQVIIINEKSSQEVLIEFYNSNGEEIHACGNGSRCVANLLMKEKQLNEIQIKTKERKLSCKRVDGDIISIDMGKPKFDWTEIPLKENPIVDNIKYHVDGLTLEQPYFVNVGNPHVIFFVEDINQYEIGKFGPLIETDQLFPEKVNVSIAQIISPNIISINVWERGAGRTLACGTAACAVAVAAITYHNCNNELEIELPGGKLDISYKMNKNIAMSGKTELSFEGRFEL